MASTSTSRSEPTGTEPLARTVLETLTSGQASTIRSRQWARALTPLPESFDSDTDASCAGM